MSLIEPLSAFIYDIFSSLKSLIKLHNSPMQQLNNFVHFSYWHCSPIYCRITFQNVHINSSYVHFNHLINIPLCIKSFIYSIINIPIYSDCKQTDLFMFILHIVYIKIHMSAKYLRISATAPGDPLYKILYIIDHNRY